MSVLWMGLAVLIAAVPLTWWMDRTFARYEREAKMRRLLAPHARAFQAFAASVGAALMPAMQQAVKVAVEMEVAMAKINESLRASGGLADLQRLAEQMSKGGKR